MRILSCPFEEDLIEFEGKTNVPIESPEVETAKSNSYLLRTFTKTLNQSEAKDFAPLGHSVISETQDESEHQIGRLIEQSP